MNASATGSVRLWRWAFAGAPLLAYAVVYALTCLIGAFLALGHFPAFREALATFSGISLPPFSRTVVRIDMALLAGAPLLFALGYMLVLPYAGRGACHWRWRAPRLAIDLRLLLFSISFAFALRSIARGGGFVNATHWLHFAAWVEARRALFHSLGFLAFVNVYLVVPLLAAWVLLYDHGSSVALRILRWSSVVLTLGISLMLFQKKTTVVTLLIILVAWLLRRRREGGRIMPILRKLVAGVMVTVAVYFTLVVAPTLGGVRVATEAGAPLAAQLESTALYAGLAPITRTSIPALYYPYVFPRLHGYYGLDIGQDVLGFGVMPDDNRVVWRYMYPGAAGAVAAPFQFVLYSQVGLAGALAGSFVIGALLAALWSLVLERVLPEDLEEMYAALVVLLGIYLAIDSVRNSLLVSYGVVWGFLLIFGLFVLASLLGAVTEARAAPRPEEG